MDVPKVAPYQSCVACFEGGTDTVVWTEGDAEFHVAALMKLGLSQQQASGTLHVYTEQELGCDPGTVPAGRFTLAIRVCRDCAAKTGAKVIELWESGTGYIQPL